MTNREIAEQIVADWPSDSAEFSGDDWRSLRAAITAALDAKTPPPGHILDDGGVVRKVLGTLPLTADGCVALPLISVVYHPDHPERTLDVDAINDGHHVVAQIGIPMPDYSCQWREYPVEECFGYAAEAARAKA